MTGHYRRNRPRTLLFAIAMLVGGHYATQDSSAAWTRTLPILLLLVLGELVRELVITRLAPTVSAEERQKRTRLAWGLLTVGMLCFVLPVIAVMTSKVARWNSWPLLLFGIGVVVAGVSSGLMAAVARDALDEKLAEARRIGSTEVLDAPGPLLLLLVIVAATGLFATINATVFERLFNGSALTTVGALRLVGTAIGIGGLTIFGWHRIQRRHQQMLDAVVSGTLPGNE
ncbi:MAG: hypothetical protein HYV19_06660 [Gemmatimonadetes bacterium]|nr:hypothetical protein [Gemmatimonadota bacterium]